MKTEFKGLITDPTIYNTCNFCEKILDLRSSWALFWKVKSISEDPILFCCDKCKEEWEELYA